MKFLFALMLGALVFTTGPRAVASDFSDIIEDGNYESRVLRNNPFKIDRKLILNAQKGAHELAQIWGDTILEGDYHAINRTRLDLLEELSFHGKVIGYRVTFSQRAWDTANCNFDAAEQETLKDCVPGRIFESGFFSKNFKEKFRDEKALAEFVED